MLDDNDTVALAYRTHDLTLLVLTWTTGNTTSYLELLSIGLIHGSTSFREGRATIKAHPATLHRPRPYGKIYVL